MKRRSLGLFCNNGLQSVENAGGVTKSARGTVHKMIKI